MPTDEFWSQFKKPIENVSKEEIQHIIDLAEVDIGERGIVDIGCGSGYSTYLLKQIFPESEVFGVDWSQAALELAISAFGDEINWLRCNFKKLSPYLWNEYREEIGLVTATQLAWREIPEGVKVGFELAGNLALLQVADWKHRYNERKWAWRDKLRSLEIGLEIVNSLNPKVLEEQSHAIYIVFKKG